METAKRLKGIGEYYFSAKLREIDELNKQGRQVINLGIGSPDLPPHPDVIRTLQEEAAKPGVHAYQSYKGSPVLRDAIAKWYQQWYRLSLDPATEILPLIGSKEGIMHICMSFLNKGDRVLVPDPGYPTYSSAVKIAGARLICYPLQKKNNYEPGFKKLQKNISGKIKLMFVNYPQMPTGQLPTTALFEKLVAFALKNKILLVHDNPYSFMLPGWQSGQQPMSLLSIEGSKECVIELNSLSKSHNMAGWRVGMLCGAAENIDQVLRFKSNMDSGMFLPVQLAAAKALSLGSDWHGELNNIYNGRREKIFQLLDLLGCEYSKQQAGLFVWAEIPPRYNNCYTMSDDLLDKAAVFITPGGIFGKAGKKFLRVSLCSPEQKIDEAIERIRTMAL